MVYESIDISPEWDIIDSREFDYSDPDQDAISKQLYLYSNLFKINSVETAISYIKDRLTDKTYYELAAIYYGLSGREIEKYNNKNKHLKINKPLLQKGGLYEEPDINDPIYKFLVLIDAAHDFKRPAINYYLDIEKYELPVGLTRHALENDLEILTFLSNTKLLTFGKLSYPNPFENISFNIFNLKERIEKNPNVTYEELVETQQRSLNTLGSYLDRKRIPLDIWCHISSVTVNNKRKEKEYYELRQLVYICKYIKEWFSNDQTLLFNVDNYNIALELILTAKYLDEAMYNIYSSDKDLKNELLMIINENKTKPIEWIISTSDANIYDNSLHWLNDIDFDNKTGVLFGKDTNNIEIGPVDNIPKNKLIDETKINYIQKEQFKTLLKIPVVIIENSLEKYNGIINSNQSKYLFSLDYIKLFLKIKGIKTKTVEDNLIDRIDDKIKDYTEKQYFYNSVMPIAVQFITRFSEKTFYMLKRAGDWGQIEHCKRYNKIFVTKDKMAALYASYRQVPYIYIKNKTVDYDYARQDPDFIQFSFILNRP